MSERQWQKDEIIFGAGELDLCKAVDVIPTTHFSRMKNVMRTMVGALTARPGLTTLYSTALGATVHSIARLEDPANNTFTRIVGIDSGVYRTVSSTLQLAETGFSGNPLSLVPFRPPLSAESWMLIGDSVKMRKIRRDGTILKLGVTGSASAPTATAGTVNKTTIDVTVSGSTWTAHTNGNVVGSFSGAGNYLLVATPGANEIGSAFFDRSITLDLSKVGTLDASDDDHIHMVISDWHHCAFVRVYFICSASFAAGYLPGTSLANPDYYWKEFTPDIYPGISNELGIIGYPLHRSEFARVGDTAGQDWSTITGLCIEVGNAHETFAAQVAVDDLWLEGGYGPDSSDLGSLGYEYVFTHYDPRTGAESNPSHTSYYEGTIDRLHLLRRSATISISGLSYGDANMRQRFYRKGGTLTDTFYYIGTNTADGASIVDTYTDTELVASGQVSYDHDVPVTTQLPNGNARYEEPLPYLAGPLGGAYIFGCGDQFRRGHLYWSRPYEPDHWPAANNSEVCSPSEQLMNVLMYNAQGYVFSRDRLFQAILNLAAADQEVITVLPTPCGHGLAGHYAFCVGPEIYFVARDGVYATSGGVERNLSEDRLGPLFHREWTAREDEGTSSSGGGYGEGGFGEGGFGVGTIGIDFPGRIDWEMEDELRLAVHENELHFRYRDTTGNYQELVYNLLTQEWRWYYFSKSLHCVVSERDGQDSVLLYGSADGKIYEHSGASDDGDEIDCLIRTGARNQGFVRAEKLYGDLTVDADLKGVSLSVRSYLNPAETFNRSSTTTSTGRLLSRHDHFPGGVLGRTASLELAWSSAEVRPLIYNAELSYLPEPERIGTRVTDWDDHNFPGNKLVKGVIIECNTFGVAKSIDIEGDGAWKTTISVTANGRQQVESSFEAFQAKLIRLKPVSTTDLAIYNVIWIADDLPLSLSRWETRPLDNGLFGYHMHYDSYVTLSSTTDVSFILTFDDTTEHTYNIPSTQGKILKKYVPFRTNKALLVKYTLTSASPFMVYRDETYVRIFPWDKADSVLFKPFGGANQDPSPRAMYG